MRANTPGVLNAAVGFDEHTLQPTYELRVGVPGASAGINIAQRLGLNPSIVDAARQRLTTQTQDVAQFLDRLHAELREIETERAELRSQRTGSCARTQSSRSRRAQRAAREAERAGEEARQPAARLRISRAGDGERRAGPRRGARSSPRTRSAASPRCAANSASSSIPPWSRTPPVPTATIRTRARTWCSTCRWVTPSSCARWVATAKVRRNLGR